MKVVNSLEGTSGTVAFLGKPKDLDEEYQLSQIFTSPMREDSDIIYLYTYTEKEGE